MSEREQRHDWQDANGDHCTVSINGDGTYSRKASNDDLLLEILRLASALSRLTAERDEESADAEILAKGFAFWSDGWEREPPEGGVLDRAQKAAERVRARIATRQGEPG